MNVNDHNCVSFLKGGLASNQPTTPLFSTLSWYLYFCNLQSNSGHEAASLQIVLSIRPSVPPKKELKEYGRPIAAAGVTD